MDVGFDSLWVGAERRHDGVRDRPDGRVDTLQVDAQGPSSFAVGRDAVWATARPGDAARRIDAGDEQAVGPSIRSATNSTMGAEAGGRIDRRANTSDGALSGSTRPARVVETIRRRPEAGEDDERRCAQSALTGRRRCDDPDCTPLDGLSNGWPNAMSWPSGSWTPNSRKPCGAS